MKDATQNPVRTLRWPRYTEEFRPHHQRYVSREQSHNGHRVRRAHSDGPKDHDRYADDKQFHHPVRETYERSSSESSREPIDLLLDKVHLNIAQFREYWAKLQRVQILEPERPAPALWPDQWTYQKSQAAAIGRRPKCQPSRALSNRQVRRGQRQGSD